METNRERVMSSINSTDAQVHKQITGIIEETHKLPKPTQSKHEEAYHKEADSQEQQQEYTEEVDETFSQQACQEEIYEEG